MLDYNKRVTVSIAKNMFQLGEKSAALLIFPFKKKKINCLSEDNLTVKIAPVTYTPTGENL